MELENKIKSTENAQITFKLNEDEKRKIEETSAYLGITVSEYLRIKSLADEKTVFDQLTKSAELEKENKTLKVKLEYYRNTERTPNSLVLPLNAEQLETLKNLFDGYGDRSIPLNVKVIRALVTFCTSQDVWDTSFIGLGYSQDEIDEIFYPDDDEE
ncbi:MAG: hypothetical protein POELPBGB_03039 [Bacteroidia bacterium]|nr:hypothetical protein [Bacteroidia bacterium]